MTQFSDWIQANWFEFGILVVLSAILATVVWFARNILKSLRASQEQVGALLRLSFSDVLPVPAGSVQSNATPAPALQERAPRGPNPLVVGVRNLVNWLNAPMSRRSASPWRKAVRWLQAPARS
jgi:uncharacterized SAM-binding protein YcdF (DUF218 family)